MGFYPKPGGGGGAATALATTGSPVVVSGAAPPTAGQVMTATSPTAADWATPSGGSGAVVLARMVSTDGIAVMGSADSNIIAGNPTQFQGPKKLAANTAQVGDRISVQARGVYTHSEGSAQQPFFGVKLGPNTTFAPSTLSIPAGSYNWKMDGDYVVVTGGASGKILGSGRITFINTSGGAVTGEAAVESTGFHTYDFTSDLANEIEVYAGGGATTNMTVYEANIEHAPKP